MCDDVYALSVDGVLTIGYSCLPTTLLINARQFCMILIVTGAC